MKITKEGENKRKHEHLSNRKAGDEPIRTGEEEKRREEHNNRRNEDQKNRRIEE